MAFQIAVFEARIPWNPLFQHSDSIQNGTQSSPLSYAEPRQKGGFVGFLHKHWFHQADLANEGAMKSNCELISKRQKLNKNFELIV